MKAVQVSKHLQLNDPTNIQLLVGTFSRQVHSLGRYIPQVGTFPRQVHSLGRHIPLLGTFPNVSKFYSWSIILPTTLLTLYLQSLSAMTSLMSHLLTSVSLSKASTVPRYAQLVSHGFQPQPCSVIIIIGIIIIIIMIRGVFHSFNQKCFIGVIETS